MRTMAGTGQLQPVMVFVQSSQHLAPGPAAWKAAAYPETAPDFPWKGGPVPGQPLFETPINGSRHNLNCFEIFISCFPFQGVFFPTHHGILASHFSVFALTCKRAFT